jgi:5-methyltetrahydrofolate--homocysteine methyltransferase
MRADLIATVLQGHLVLADGSMGAMLQARGLPAGVLPEVWNLERPDVVRAVHRAYVEAGAQMLVTNTIGGNRLRLEGAGLGAAAMVIAMNRAAATLAREVAGDEVWVAGSVGPTGMLMAPYGELSVAEAEEMFAEQIVALAEGGVDAILIETQHDGDEAYAAVRAARENAALPVLCTFAFDVRGRTLMGLRPDEAARRALDAGADLVGANCGEGPAAVEAGLAPMRAVCERPLVAQANAGMPRLGGHGDAVWDVTPAEMADHALRCLTLGAGIIGGCCGTGPAHIAAMSAALFGTRSQNPG